MKLSHATAATAAIMIAIAGNRTPRAEGSVLEVSFGEEVFQITYDDNLDTSYEITWSADQIDYTFSFLGNCSLETFVAGTEKYALSYLGGSVDAVVQQRRRMLRPAKGPNEAVADTYFPYGFEDRRLHTCGGCEAAWDCLCQNDTDAGVGSLCSVLNFPSAVDPEIMDDGIEEMCDILTGACGNWTAQEICAGQCVPGEAESAIS